VFKQDEIIVLLGAGCSADAGIPTSQQMMARLEDLLNSHEEWKEFKDLYHLTKTAIQYSDGIQGRPQVDVDIERLVNVLGELERKENSLLYPFVGSWNSRLLEIAGYNFETTVSRFRQKIVQQLSNWVSLENYKDSRYYTGLFQLQQEYDFALRVFSLNYDLCMERNKPNGVDLERGFDPDRRVWDWKRFEPREEYEPQVYLYKLHGSIDWRRDSALGNIVIEVDNIPETPDLIFGTNYKLQYVDPYLFYAYELRRYSLLSRLILAIGYSFRDEHINGILQQALRAQKTRRIISVGPKAREETPRLGEEVLGQALFRTCPAKDFLSALKLTELEASLGEA
jgi:hypothetical protein